MKLRRQKLLVEPPSGAVPDVAFLLLIFFLVCASDQPDSGRSQEIPRAEENSEEQNEDENIELSISGSAITVNGNPIREEALPAKMSSLLDGREEESDRIVVVKSASDTPYTRWIGITTMVEDAGGVITLQLEEQQTITVE